MYLFHKEQLFSTVLGEFLGRRVLCEYQTKLKV